MSIMSIIADICESFDVLSEIGSVSSTNAKQDILRGYGHNDVLKTLLFSAYNPFVQYNIKKIPVPVSDCTGDSPTESNYSDFLALLVRLSKREVTGNAAIQELSEFLEDCCPEEYLWYTRVIEKDLDIGMADKGINKVFKGLIPVYEVLLAEKIPADGLNLDTPKVLKMLPNRIVCQYKIDGYRLNIHVPQVGAVKICTRNGKEVKGYKDLEQEASSVLPKGYVYDGEIVDPALFDWIASNSQTDEAVAACRDLFSQAMSHAFFKEDNKQGIFNMFDMVPMKEWVTNRTTETLEVRTNRIIEMIQPLDLKHITVVPTSRVYLKSNPDDLKEIVELFHKFLNVGWEGLMIKNWDAVYEFKRNKNLLKMKLMDTIDLVVTDVYEGTGKYTGMLGGVYVDYKGYQVGVGSGWSDEQRQYYWQDKNKIVGKTIEIAYQAESSNKDGGLSLSFPVVKKVRDDK